MTLSQCCKAPVSADLKRQAESKGWHITKTIHICDKCQKECEVIDNETRNIIR